MMRPFLAALFVLLLFQTQGQAQTPRCLDEQTLRSILTRQNANLEIAGLSVLEAAQFVDGFNALPPATQLAADALLLVGEHNGPQVAIAFFRQGCMVSRGLLPRQQVDILLLQLERSGA